MDTEVCLIERSPYRWSFIIKVDGRVRSGDINMLSRSKALAEAEMRITRNGWNIAYTLTETRAAI
jgi:hypothetical protein